MLNQRAPSGIWATIISISATPARTTRKLGARPEAIGHHVQLTKRAFQMRKEPAVLQGRFPKTGNSP